MKDFYDQLSEPARAPAQIADEDLQWLMSSPRGRRVARRFLEATYADYPSYVAGDTHATAFNEGRRFVGLALVTDIRRLCPEQELAMRAEKDL